MATITIHDGETKLQYASEEAYEAALDWYNASANSKPAMIAFCAARGVVLTGPDGNLVEDWADLAMHCWAKSEGLAA